MASQDDIEKSYTCPVCLEIYKDPVRTVCDHVLCRACFMKCQEASSNRCPICRQLIQGQEVSPDMYMSRQIAAVQGTCKGCNQQMTLKSLREHGATCPNRMCTVPKFKPVAKTSQPLPSDVPNRSTFRCPYCTQENLDLQGLRKHCNENHRTASPHVVCPVCASMPWGDPNMKSGNFIQHLNMRHKFEYDTYVDYKEDDDAMLQAAIQESLKS